jgi:proline iminopeptidase
MTTMRSLACGALLAVGGYACVIRPRLLRWGATDEEVQRLYPGVDLIPGGTRSPTMAVEIDAPPSKVWPWLVQMGYGRAGWYSWDHLDNWGRKSETALHPEWQQIAVGDRLPSMPNNASWWEVAALEPERFLGLRATMDLQGHPFDPSGPRPPAFTDSLWGFLLEATPEGGTRLVVSGYWAMRPRWLKALTNIVFLEPAHWIMQSRQFANLKRLAESEPLPAPAPARTDAPRAAETVSPRLVKTEA